MGSEISDFDLEKGSQGVEGEDHYSTECVPEKKIGRFINGSKYIGLIVGFFRYCRCGKYNEQECKSLMRKSETSTIPLPSDGFDIHRDKAGCYYSCNPNPKFVRVNGVQKNLYTYKLHCYCKVTSRTAYYKR